MNGSRVTCIVPTYNGESYLAEALDSIFAQTYRPLEVIVADDGSTDGTLRVAARYAPGLRVVAQPNGGPAAARNLGLRETSTDFVAFLDQDDVWHPEKLARQMGRFDARPEIDLSIAYVQRFWTDSLRRQERRFRGHRVSKPIPGYVTGTFLARRRVFDIVGLFDADVRFADSMQWLLRAAERNIVFELLPDVLLRHRMHGDNLSQSEPDGSRDEFLRVLKASLDRRRALANRQ